MKCPICNDFEGNEASVAAHLCGRHDPDHQQYVGLKDDGTPLTREENELRKQEAKPDLELEPEPEPEAEEESGSGNAVAGGLAAAFAGLVAKEYLENKKENERGRI